MTPQPIGGSYATSAALPRANSQHCKAVNVAPRSDRKLALSPSPSALQSTTARRGNGLVAKFRDVVAGQSQAPDGFAIKLDVVGERCGVAVQPAGHMNFHGSD
jgi:hypothetical protein